MKPLTKRIIIGLLLILLGIVLTAVVIVALFACWLSPSYMLIGGVSLLPAWLGFIFLAALSFGLLTLKTKGAVAQNISTTLGLTMLIIAFLPSIFGLESYDGEAIMKLIFALLGVQLIYARRAGYLVALMSLLASAEIFLVLFFLAMSSLT